MGTVGLWTHAGRLCAQAAALLSLLAALAAPSLAQDRFTSSLFGGITVPVGDFGDELGEEAGLATPGVGLGIDIGVPIKPVRGLGWQSAVEGMFFGVEDDFLVEGIGEGADLEIGRYWGALLFTGLRYSVAANPYLRLHGTGQLGVGVFRGPGVEVSAMGESAEYVSYWEPVRGYSVGAGASVNDRVDVEARYAMLVNPELEGELRYGSMVEEIKAEQPVSWVRVTIGLRLR